MTLELATRLIKLSSVTPDDGGCMPLITARLEKHGFRAVNLRFDDTDNLWITHGTGEPVLCLLGHTDVVPPGPLDKWQSDPFAPEIRDGYLYGRGAADMKGSIAAMVTAMERFVSAHPQHEGTLAMLLTSDEEGRATNGTIKVVDYLTAEGIRIKWCIVGEPSSQHQAGDTVKNGRRGSLTGHLTVHGVQGHVAYPERSENPIHRLMPVLHELCSTIWDYGNRFYTPTSFQISNINAGTGADNVIPGTIKVQFNFRYSTEVTEMQLKGKVESLLMAQKLRFELEWLPSSKPFLTDSGDLLRVTQQVIQETTGQSPQISTSGGTSDGRFIAPTGAEVVELGPVNDTIHKLNECVKVSDLELLSRMYEKIIAGLLAR
jgi:succinyl-diaminopimelate desuccinylase